MIAVDVGNTSLHFLWLDRRGRITKTKIVPTSDASLSGIKGICSGKKESIVVCSVVPGITEIFRKIKKEFNRNTYIVGEDIKVPIKSSYNRHHIGMDRLVAAYAAKKIYKNARIIIDFGTAITFDILSKDGDYEGGLILPGLGSTLKVLSSCALLPKKIELHKTTTLVPKDTKDSINRGIAEGFSAMLNSLIEKYKKILKLNKNAKIIITGGDARFVLPGLKGAVIFDRFLVIKGLFLLAEEFPS
ncbi:MAG: type III pantothenate kinase [Candidatus Omnitrophica bacterium]|nr:type III pantothenate kinase [Candidatus Omnitrophota bacterium]